MAWSGKDILILEGMFRKREIDDYRTSSSEAHERQRPDGVDSDELDADELIEHNLGLVQGDNGFC